MRLLLLSTVFLLLAPVALAQTPEAIAEARALLLDEQPQAAAEVLERGGREALSPEARYLLGRIYQTLQRHQAAADVLATADTSEQRVLAALGRSYHALGQRQDAEAAYERAYRMDSANVPVATAWADLLGERRRWGEVRAVYERLLEEDPENPLFHTSLAGAHRRLDSTDAAIIHYEIARRLAPASLAAILPLTVVYHQAEMLNAAQRVIEQSLELLPEEPLVLTRCGELALQAEAFERAVACFEGAIAYGDSSFIAHRNVGVARYLDGDVTGALEPLRTAWALAQEEDGMTAYYLGVVHQLEQQFDSSMVYLRQAADLLGRETIADLYAQIALTEDLMERDADAIGTYRLARELAPEKPELVFRLAALYDSYYADQSMAVKEYERFLGLVEEGQLPEMQEISKRRLTEIREAEFFRQGTAPADTAAAPEADTSGAGG